MGGGQHGAGEGALPLALAAGLHVGVAGRDGDEVADVVAVPPRGRPVSIEVRRAVRGLADALRREMDPRNGRHLTADGRQNHKDRRRT